MVGQRQAPARRERGQILVIFALGLIVIIGMVGLVLDGGSAFAMRRTEQNAADFAAVAGANAYLHGSQSGVGNHAAWQATARDGGARGRDPQWLYQRRGDQPSTCRPLSRWGPATASRWTSRRRT